MGNIDFDLFFRAIGMCLILEGILWAGCTESMRQLMEKAIEERTETLRNGGLIAIVVGFVIIWGLG